MLCSSQFSQNIALKEKLISTYPKILVESCPEDKIWGIGLSQDDERAWNESTWKGENLLGKILVKVRKRLMDDSEWEVWYIYENGFNWELIDWIERKFERPLSLCNCPFSATVLERYWCLRSVKNMKYLVIRWANEKRKIYERGTNAQRTVKIRCLNVERILCK